MSKEIYSENLYYYITPSGATGYGVYQVYSGRCILIGITINKIAEGTYIGIIDNTSGSTVDVGEIGSPKTTRYEYDVRLDSGLRINMSGAADVTIIYRV